MSTTLVQTAQLTLRELRPLARQPLYILFSLMQPMVWLLLFSQLFGRVAELPGFEGGNYLSFMLPGVIAMTAIFGSTWLGTGFIQDMQRGVMNRFLVSPARRHALLLAKAAQNAVTLLVQVVIILGIGFLMGARYSGGPLGMLAALAAIVLLATGFGMFSTALALLFGRQESLIATSNFLIMPMMFLSSALMAPTMAPDWIRTVAGFNPVEWTVATTRAGLGAAPDWGTILSGLGGVLAFAVALSACATLAFRSYQKSV